MVFSILALGIFFFIDYTNGGCGDCQDNFVACQSVNTFSLCIKGEPYSNEILKCPDGRVCTDKPTICMENFNSSFVASCGKGCDVCNSHDKVFSCLGRTEVAYCFGEILPFYSVMGRCPEGYVCDLSSREVCVRKEYSEGSCERDYNNATSPKTTELPIIEITTSRSSRDVNTFCRENAMEGTFPKEGDLTCKDYYICKAISNGTSFMGYSYSCSGSNYFDPDKRFCSRDKPSSC